MTEVNSKDKPKPHDRSLHVFIIYGIMKGERTEERSIHNFTKEYKQYAAYEFLTNGLQISGYENKK